MYAYAQEGSDQTEDAIRGQAVVGALAGTYLQTHAPDDRFDHLFLSGAVRFSNLYITDPDFRLYLPVPRLFGKTKQEEQILDLTLHAKQDTLVKPLKGGYICGGQTLRKPQTERVYHNALHKEGGGLYIQNCLQSGQLFLGTITGTSADLQAILPLLTQTHTLSFGRSKTAQYAKCTLAALDVSPYAPRRIAVEPGDTVVYYFGADALIPDAMGGTTVDAAAVCAALGIDPERLLPESVLESRVVSGFLSVMGMRRTYTKAIRAGSALVWTCTEQQTLDEIFYIGGRQSEGYGKVYVWKAGEMAQLAHPHLSPLSTAAPTDPAVYHKIEQLLTTLKQEEALRSSAIAYARSKKSAFLRNWNPAFIGRVALMLQQSTSLADLTERICSIKTEEKQQLALRLKDDALARLAQDDPVQGRQAHDSQPWERQQAYLQTILTLAKYFHKGGDTP